MFKFEGMNFSGSLRVNNEKTKGRLVFPYLSAFTRSHVRDPNRCTLSLRLRLGTATTRDNKRKKDARTSCAVAARGFKFDSLFFTSPRDSSFCFLSPLFSLFLASPLFFSKRRVFD